MNYEQNLPKQKQPIALWIGILLIISYLVANLIRSTIPQTYGMFYDTRPTIVISEARNLASEQTRINQDTWTDEPTDQWSESMTNWEVQSTNSIELQHNVDCNKIFLPNGEATIRARYACNILPNRIMLASFHQESGWNPNALGSLGERWLCQMLPNKTNNVFIKDARRSEWKYQIRMCVSKRKVSKQEQIRASYSSKAYRQYLKFYPK